jgi:hypothetical protein
LRSLPDFANFGVKVFDHFLNFDAFSTKYSARLRKILKNGALVAKIGVDTADILIIWPSAKSK